MSQAFDIMGDLLKIAADMTVANTILQQLGGGRFKTMTGAHSFSGDANSLTFKLPGKAGYVKDGIRAVKITLTPQDEYNMEFYAPRGSFEGGDYRFEVVARHDGIYVDQLQELFSETTGLATHL